MPDSTQRFIVQVQGIADLQRLEQTARDAQRALDSLKAAQAQVQSGGTLTPALLRAATGGASVGPADLDPAMATALKDAQQKATQATKDHADAQKAVAKGQADHNKALDAYIQLAGKSSSAADREWAAQQRKNAELQKSLFLYNQLIAAGQNVPPLGAAGGAGAAAGRLGFLGTNLVAGLASRVAIGTATAAGGAAGGAAAQAASSGVGSLLGALPAPAKLAGAAGLSAILSILGYATIQRYLAAQRQTLAGATGGVGAPTDVLRGVLGAGRGFLVDPTQNAQYAQQLGQLGVPRSRLQGSLGLSYALATQTGGDIGQTTQLVGQFMARTGQTTEQAAHSLQRFVAAADAAHISAQRLLSLQQQAAQAGLAGTFNMGQVASLQGQLGQNVNPVQALAGPLGAVGSSALVLQSVLGLSHAQLRTLQQNPAQMLDAISRAAQAQSGGNRDVTAQLLQSEFGLDLSQFTPGQVDALTRSRPGQFMAAAQKASDAARVATVPSADAYIRAQAAARAGLISPSDQAVRAAQYEALVRLIPLQTPSGGAYPLPPGADPNPPGPAPTPTPTPTPGHAPGRRGGHAPRGIPTPGPGDRNPRTGAPTVDARAFKPAMLPPVLRPYYSAYVAASAATGIPPALLAAQDLVESSGNPKAYNPYSGATGLGQLKPSTAAIYGKFDLLNPAQNIMAQAKYDADLYRSFGNYTAMFGAYQEGPGAFAQQGTRGVEPGYLDKIAAALNALAHSGLTKEVRVIVTDSSGRALPATTTIRPAPSATPTPPPGSHRGGH